MYNSSKQAWPIRLHACFYLNAPRFLLAALRLPGISRSFRIEKIREVQHYVRGG